MPRTIEGEPLTKMFGLDFAPKFHRCTVEEEPVTVKQLVCLARLPESAGTEISLKGIPVVRVKVEVEEQQPEVANVTAPLDFSSPEVQVKKEEEEEAEDERLFNTNERSGAFAAVALTVKEQMLVKKDDNEELFCDSMDNKEMNVDAQVPMVETMKLNYYDEKHGYIRRFFVNPVTFEMYTVTSSGRIVVPTRRYPAKDVQWV